LEGVPDHSSETIKNEKHKGGVPHKTTYINQIRMTGRRFAYESVRTEKGKRGKGEKAFFV
jgi:hypothetical protein